MTVDCPLSRFTSFATLPDSAYQPTTACILSPLSHTPPLPLPVHRAANVCWPFHSFAHPLPYSYTTIPLSRSPSPSRLVFCCVSATFRLIFAFHTFCHAVAVALAGVLCWHVAGGICRLSAMSVCRFVDDYRRSPNACMCL